MRIVILSIVLLSLCGFGLSLYAYRLERALAANPEYKPACELSDRISCTKPILSEYGSILGVSNGILGLLFYSMMEVAAFVGAVGFIFYASAAACLVSLYLAYLLIFRIHAICPVCISIYAVNFALLVASYLNYFGA
jgi:vitamin-K-epoxide reductase (warfarin-sensitive)